MVLRKRSRREFLDFSLRGLGTCLALPALEIFGPSHPALGNTAGPRRALFIYMSNGAQIKPSTTGTNFTLPPALSPLAALQDYLTVISGTNMQPAVVASDTHGGGHGPAAPSWLTATTPGFPGPSTVRSFDLMLADTLSASSRYASINISGEVGAGSDSGWSSAYIGNVSYPGGNQVNTSQTDPANLFNTLFGGGSMAAQATQQAQRKDYSKSILDFVLSDANSFSTQLGAGDSAKLQEYLQGVRDLETRIGATTVAPAPASCAPGTAPAAQAAYLARIPLLYDILYQAMVCGLTNVGTFMLMQEASAQAYPNIMSAAGMTAHHDISHDGSADGYATIARIVAWHMTALATFALRLKGTAEGSGNMLDNSVLMFGGGIGNGAAHAHTDLPLAIIGKGTGAIPGGRHIAASGVPTSNTYVAIAKALGAPIVSVGDSTGPQNLT